VKRRGERGITLIEVAVVMAIVGIMALFMAPAIGEWLDNYRIRQSARDISSTLQQAKMKAISTRTQHTVNFDTDNNRYTLQPGGNATALPRGVTMESGSAATITFRPDGTSTSPGEETITINNAKGKEYHVTVNTVGRISIQEE